MRAGNVGGSNVLQKLPADGAEIGGERGAKAAGKVRLLSLANLDGRTLARKKTDALVAAFTAELGGGELSVTARIAVERAARMLALAEDSAARRLGGDLSVSLDDITRTDNAAARAVRDLGLGKREVKQGPTLAEYLAQREAAE